MTFVSTLDRVSVGLHHAKAELHTKDPAKKQHHRNVLMDLVEGSPYPHTVLNEIVRRLGRQRSMQLGVDRSTINHAISLPKTFNGRL